jgi:PAS domain S-box-containing protein
VNRAFLELSGYSMDEVIRQPALDIMKPFDTKFVRNLVDIKE